MVCVCSVSRPEFLPRSCACIRRVVLEGSFDREGGLVCLLSLDDGYLDESRMEKLQTSGQIKLSRLVSPLCCRPSPSAGDTHLKLTIVPPPRYEPKLKKRNSPICFVERGCFWPEISPTSCSPRPSSPLALRRQQILVADADLLGRFGWGTS